METKHLITLTVLLTFLSKSSQNFLDDKCLSSGWSCLDCYTRKYCLGSSLWNTKPCLDSLTNFQNPYCDPRTGKCVTSEPPGCEPKTHFKCIRPGIFPDIQNCTRYFTCKNEDEITTFNCNATYYYKPSWGKCVFRVTSDECEPTQCSFGASKDVIKDEPSLFYECSGGAPTLKGCPLSTQVYQIGRGSCISKCNKDSIGLMPKTMDCTKFYNCEYTDSQYVIKEYQCPPGQGFNSIVKRCENKYNYLCNEFALLESDLDYVLGKIPFATYISDILKSLFRLFKFNPFTLILSFGFKTETVSSGIVILNYFIKNRGIPPAIITNVIDTVLGFLPKPIRGIIEAIIKIISNFIPLPSFRLQRRDLGDSYTVPVLHQILQNAKLNIEDLYQSNFSGVTSALGRSLMEASNLPEEALPEILEIIRKNLRGFVDVANRAIGLKVFESAGNVVKVDAARVMEVFEEGMKKVLVELKEHNLVFGQLFEELMMRYRGAIYGDVTKFFDELRV